MNNKPIITKEKAQKLSKLFDNPTNFKQACIKVLLEVPDEKLDFYKGNLTFSKNGGTILTKIEQFCEQKQFKSFKN